MGSDVFIIENKFLTKLEKGLKKVGLRRVKGKSVAIKIHMGEYGNLNYLRPSIVGRVVELVKEYGGKPFIFETTTAFKSSRDTKAKYYDTARRNGFTEETIGCPIIISNKGVKVEVGGKLGKVEVGKKLYEADFLIVISHSKGHCMVGYGGAIKNIGIGCMTTRTKDAVHSESHPILKKNCDGCGKCIPVCRWKAIEPTKNKIKIIYSKCTGCEKCIKACPINALKSRKMNLQELIAESASAVIKKFKKNQIFINVLFDITAECDCEDTKSKMYFPVCNDIGFLISKDPIAIDNAAIDLIDKNGGIDILLKLHKKNPREIIDFSYKLKLGNKKYDLKKIKIGNF